MFLERRASRPTGCGTRRSTPTRRSTTAFTAFQEAVGVDAQTEAAGTLQTLLNDEVPIGLPFFYNYLSGHSNSFQGVRVSALGQMFTEKASQV